MLISVMHLTVTVPRLKAELVTITHNYQVLSLEKKGVNHGILTAFVSLSLSRYLVLSKTQAL